MSLVALTAELARRVQAEGIEGKHFPLALRLVAQTWHARDLPGQADHRWGLAVGGAQDVADMLFPQPPNSEVVLTEKDLDVSDEQARSAVAGLLLVMADTVGAASNGDEATAWTYAEAEAKLRTAAQDLL